MTAERSHEVRVTKIVGSAETEAITSIQRIPACELTEARIGRLTGMCLVRPGNIECDSKPYRAATILFDLVRLHRQHKVWRFSGAVWPPLDTGMM